MSPPGCFPSPGNSRWYPAWDGGSPAAIPLYRQSLATLEALHLIELGARVGLVCQLTQLEKSLVHRLYRQARGHSSPPGQTPFSDAWYQESDQRLLQAAVVWQLYARLATTGAYPARVLIEVYESYRRLVTEPLLDITRVAFVPRLVAMGLWRERRCTACGTCFVASQEDYRSDCPGCRLYHRHRCRQCRGTLPHYAGGRRRQRCPDCQGSKPRP